MDKAKTFNRMSIEHLLCSPSEGGSEDRDHTFYGLPSPVSSYDSNDEEDDYDYDYDYSHGNLPISFIPPQPMYQHHRSNSSNSVYQLGRAILPYRRRRSSSSNSNAARMQPTHTRVPWTPDEDMLLKQGYEQGLSWAMIASIHLPHRSRGCCWGRFKTLKNKKFLNIQRQIRAKAKPWKTLNAFDMQQSLSL